MVCCDENSGIDETGRDLEIDWSHGTDDLPHMTDSDPDSIFEAHVPILPPNECLILIETQAVYRPPVWFGVDPITMDSFVATRRRFVPGLEWDGGSVGV